MSQNKKKYIKEALRYNLCTLKQKLPYLHAQYVLPLFMTNCQRAIMTHHKKGGGGVECLALAKLAHKA